MVSSMSKIVSIIEHCKLLQNVQIYLLLYLHLSYLLSPSRPLGMQILMATLYLQDNKIYFTTTLGSYVSPF